MRYVLGPMHLVILSPSPSAFLIHLTFPGEFGFDQAGAGATYLGRTEKQMSIRGSCSQMCMPQRCAGVGMSRHRVASEVLHRDWHLLCPSVLNVLFNVVANMPNTASDLGWLFLGLFGFCVFLFGFEFFGFFVCFVVFGWLVRFFCWLLFFSWLTEYAQDGKCWH